MKKTAAFALLLCTLLSLPARADDLQTLIDKIITSYGGEAVWHATTGIREEGSRYSQRRHFAGKITRSYQHPGKLSIDIRYKGSDTELRQLDGDKAWSHGKPEPEPFVLASRLEAYRLAPLLLLLEHRSEIKDLGRRDDDDGHPHEGLMVALDHGLKVMMDVDPESGRIVGAWGMMTLDGKPAEFATLYEDFRQVQGRLLSFKETHYAMSDYTGYTLIEKVEFVDGFPASTFHPAGE